METITTDFSMLEPLLKQYNITPEMLGFLGGAIVAVMFIFVIFFIVWYVLGAIGLSSLAKTKGYSNTWLAWIPVANSYLLAKTAFDDSKFGWAYLGLTILFWFVNIPYESTILMILGFIVLGFLFKRFSKSNIVLTIVNIITFGLLSNFFIFGIRKNDEV